MNFLKIIIKKSPATIMATQNNNTNRYKTKFCKNYEDGNCQFGSKCSYAHGKSDLRILNEDEKEICWFFNNGTCTNGNLCPYLHEYSNARKPVKLQRPCFEYHVHNECNDDECQLEHYKLTDEEFTFHFPNMRSSFSINIDLNTNYKNAGFNWSNGVPDTIKNSIARSNSPDWGEKIFYKHPVDNMCNNVDKTNNTIPDEVNILIENIMCAAEKLKMYSKLNPEIYNNALSRLLF
jgi:hypothetical protein